MQNCSFFNIENCKFSEIPKKSCGSLEKKTLGSTESDAVVLEKCSAGVVSNILFYHSLLK